jgi:hypothetical protein
LAAPARRALVNTGILKLAQLKKFHEVDIAELHGMGPNALKSLKAAMKRDGFTFKS